MPRFVVVKGRNVYHYQEDLAKRRNTEVIRADNIQAARKIVARNAERDRAEIEEVNLGDVDRQERPMAVGSNNPEHDDAHLTKEERRRREEEELERLREGPAVNPDNLPGTGDPHAQAEPKHSLDEAKAGIAGSPDAEQRRMNPDPRKDAVDYAVEGNVDEAFPGPAAPAASSAEGDEGEGYDEDEDEDGDGDGDEKPTRSDLSKMTRADLNDMARERGVQNPEDLDTKLDVIEAIEGTY